jgi:LPXTG-site transpeptidase (sortase) family protein
MNKPRIIIGGLIAVVILAIAGYVAYDFWSVQQKTHSILRAPGVIAAGQDNEEKSKEGSETAEPSSNDLANYRVAPDEPRALYIDTLNIAARIRPMGLNTDKSIQAPTNIYDAGWYTGSAKPGANGALFIDGHASGDTRYGLFGSLDLLKKGDMVTVEKGDGTKLKYKVVQTETVSLKDVDMNKVLAPYPGVTKGLNLMTCTGVWVKDAATLDKRVIVYTAAV